MVEWGFENALFKGWDDVPLLEIFVNCIVNWKNTTELTNSLKDIIKLGIR